MSQRMCFECYGVGIVSFRFTRRTTNGVERCAISEGLHSVSDRAPEQHHDCIQQTLEWLVGYIERTVARPRRRVDTERTVERIVNILNDATADLRSLVSLASSLTTANRWQCTNLFRVRRRRRTST